MNALSKLITLCTLLMVVSISSAVDFQYSSGQQTLNTSISGSDYSGPISNEDSKVFTSSYSDSAIEIVNNYSSSNATANTSLFSFPDCDKQMADMHIACSVSSTSYYDGVDISVNTQLTTANEPDGLGYIITIVATEEGEKVGDLVSVSLELNPYVNISGDNTYAWMKGPADRDHFCIALNPEYGEDGMPTEETEIFSHDNILSNVSFNDSIKLEFEAKIGDRIGVFLDLGCTIQQADTNFRYANVSAPIYLEMELYKNRADINNDGYVNLLDVAILADNWLWTRSQE